MRKSIFLFFLMLLSLQFANAAGNGNAAYNVVPLPDDIRLTKATPFVLNNSCRIVSLSSDDDMMRNARFLAEYVRETSGLSLNVMSAKKGEKGDICLTIDKRIKNKEGYKITIDAKRITISGSTHNGVFYGIQMLRKSLPIAKEGFDVVTMPAAVITDEPRFAYRGMHLDCARHFFSIDFVKKYIDILALHNMNTFHWHLSDDQGWRIEIKKYPKLTQVGSVRTGTIMGHNSDVDDGKTYGGFYTQQQAREIVEYARQRCITVIPEIDMPGHMLAALTAYPELGCTGGPYRVGHNWGVYRDILCAGNEKTFTFVQDVLNEILEIFPSQLIHIGGDEAPKVRWEHCEKCQQRIKEEGLVGDSLRKPESLLQGYFTKRVEKFLAQKGRRIIGWDEILDCDVLPSTTIMSWRGVEPGAKAAGLGHDVIMAPNALCYFDHYQTDNNGFEPMLIGGYLPVENVYNFEPVPANISSDVRSHIIGAQANLWTEYIDNTNLVEYQVLPRMAALSEVLWMRPEHKNYNGFLNRLNALVALYKAYGLVYARHLWPEYKEAERSEF